MSSDPGDGLYSGQQPGKVLKDQSILMTVFESFLLLLEEMVLESLTSVCAIFVACCEPTAFKTSSRLSHWQEYTTTYRASPCEVVFLST